MNSNQNISEKVINPVPTKTFVLDIGRKCNINCKFCYYHHLGDLSKQGWEEYDDMIDVIDAGILRGNNRAEVTGGEPTIYPRMEDLVGYLKSKNIDVCIITNGIVSEPILRSLILAGTDEFLISVHGGKDTHNALTQCESARRSQDRTLSILSEANLKYGFRFNYVINVFNQDEIIDSANYMAGWKPTMVNFILFNPHHGWQYDADTKNMVADLNTVEEQLRIAIKFLESKEIGVNVRYYPICRITEDFRRCVCNDFQVCLSPNTKIKLLNGTSLTIKELSKIYKKGKRFWVYSLDKDNNLVAGKAHSSRITKRNAECIELNLDNGKKIVCTPEHLLRARNGKYIKAKDSLNVSLSPLYTRKDRYGYEEYYNINNDVYENTHKVICKLKKKNRWIVRHHINFNKLDNTPDNLKLMSWKEHRDYHIGLNSERGKNPEFRKRVGKKISDARKTMFKNGFKQNLSKLHSKQSIEKMKKARKGQSSSMKGKKHSEETKEKMSKIKKGCVPWNKGVSRIEEVKRKISGGLKKYYLTHESPFKKMWAKNRKEMLQIAKKASPFKTEKHKIEVRERMLNGQSQDMNKLKWGIRLNHKVIKIKKVGVVSEVYDLTVEKYHNFALDSGVFVHNCFDPKEWDYGTFPKTYENYRRWGIDCSNNVEEKGEPCCFCDLQNICGGVNKYFHKASKEVYGEQLIPQSIAEDEFDKLDFYHYRKYNFLTLG